VSSCPLLKKALPPPSSTRGGHIAILLHNQLYELPTEFTPEITLIIIRMSTESKDAVFLKCMKGIRAEKENWIAADKSGNKKAKQQAEENISAYMAGASGTVPPVAPSCNKVQENLFSGSNLFATGGDTEKKRSFLSQITSSLVFCSQVKTVSDLAADLATGGGRIALSCLAERHPWMMSDGTVEDVVQMTSHNGTTTTLAWDQNHNGILDQQETWDSTGHLVEPPHTITDGDTWTDIVNGLWGMLS
jgi:hypothetical protein